MSLLSLLGRKNLVVLGLNSGTSCDGLDLAVVRITRQRSKIQSKFIYGTVKTYPDLLKLQLLDIADSKSIELEKLIALDMKLGLFFGQQARLTINKMKKQNINIDLIASHGQTIRHLPRYFETGGKKLSGSLQIGSLEQIATTASLPVVGDFRQADLAVGGEGAPITGPALRRLIGNAKHSYLIVNIGGMSNFFYFPSRYSDRRSKAVDCGPGNVLIDTLCRKLFDQPYDRGGKLAKKGSTSEELLKQLFTEISPSAESISTGRELFGPSVAELMIRSKRHLRLSNNDLLATAAEFTVRSIVRKIKPFFAYDRELKKLYLTGGGRLNNYMLNRLAESLNDIEVLSIDVTGLNGDIVEAASFAVLGEATLRSESLAVSRNKGRQPIGGKIVQPPVKGNGNRKQ